MRVSSLLVTAIILIFNLPAMAGTLQDENLLAPLPNGFKVGSSIEKGNMSMNEFVPQGETVEDWSQMVTVQIFHGVAGEDPDAFAGHMKKLWTNACTGGEVKKIKTTTENGYPVSIWMFTCPLNPQTRKPENMWLKAISGKDSFYTVQYAYRRELTQDIIPPTMKYLDQVTACDTRLADRPCPPGM